MIPRATDAHCANRHPSHGKVRAGRGSLERGVTAWPGGRGDVALGYPAHVRPEPEGEPVPSTVRRPSASAEAPWGPASGGGARWLPALVGLVCTGLYVLYSVAQWRRGHVPSWDNAIFTQLLKSYAAGGPPAVDIKGHGFNLLGDHFHPLLVVLAPIYGVFPSGLTLMIAQDVLLGISAVVVTRCAVRALGPAPAAAVGVAYGLSFGMQNAVAVQFHEVCLAVPLLALGLCALRERRWQAATLWTAPVALVKEDLGITVAMVGALMVGHALRPAPGVRTWRPARGALSSTPAVWGSVLVLWGVGASLLAVTVILPGLNPQGAFAYADKLDMAAIVSDPAGAFLSMFTPGQKLGTWALTLAAGAVIAVRSPLALVALPTLVWRMLSPNHGYWGPGWHYSAVVMPVLFIALVDAVARLRGAGDRSRGARIVARTAPWAALLVALAVGTQQPLAELAERQTYATDPRARVKEEMVAAVPEGASVATDLTLINALVPRADVHWIGHTTDPPPRYVVIDRASGTWGDSPPRDVARYAQETYGRPYVVERDEGNIALARLAAP